MRGSTVLDYIGDQMHGHAKAGLSLRPDEIKQLADVVDELVTEFRRVEEIAGIPEDDAAECEPASNVVQFPARKAAQ